MSKSKKTKKALVLYPEREVTAVIDRLAKALGTSKTDIANRLLKRGLEETKQQFILQHAEPPAGPKHQDA